MAVYLLVNGLVGPAAKISRLAMWFFIVFYVALDAMSVVATGISVSSLQRAGVHPSPAKLRKDRDLAKHVTERVVVRAKDVRQAIQVAKHIFTSKPANELLYWSHLNQNRRYLRTQR